MDLDAIVKHFGASVREVKLDADLSGMLVRDGALKIITVARGHHQHRKRFTIAHELGHLVMHPGRPYIAESAHVVRVDRRVNAAGLADPREEYEANQFAAALLMPRTLVEEQWNRHAGEDADRTIDGLASRFQVSAAAMRYRVSNLGLYIPSGGK
ncbi:MAG TPA: ImmA/IrrE family metallo-endopeptidase [Candidatus Eremiobacteraceae bacterium]|nr:ImmA/IrrE family metallo-endopeptidase [Candidatus Eremiobacteraceae bacterium]